MNSIQEARVCCEYEKLYPSHERDYQSNYNRKYYTMHAYEKSKNTLCHRMLNKKNVIVKQSSIDKYALAEQVHAINIIRTERGYPKVVVV